MEFNFEEKIREIIKKQPYEEEVLKDPGKEKLKDYRRRKRGLRFEKKGKSERKMFHRSFRQKNNNFCNQVVMTKFDNEDIFIEPVFKKTSGTLTK